MNPEAEAVLNEILKLDPEVLTRDQRDFLRARSSYLKKAQLEEYKSVLEMVEEPVKPAVVAAPENHPGVPNDALSYQELLVMAKSLGYVGARLKRPQLEQYIKEHSN